MAEIHVFPFNVFTLVLVLLQDEHVVVEELLKLLVCIIDTQLFEAVDLVAMTYKKRRRSKLTIVLDESGL